MKITVKTLLSEIELWRSEPRSVLIERLNYAQLYALSDQGRKLRSRHVRGPALIVDSYQDSSYYVFDYKSNPSTTGLRHKGYIKFVRPTQRTPTTSEYLECIVDCDCHDYKYRWAYANKQRGSGEVGNQSLNQALNQAPRITNPTGRPGLCKHLLALADSIFGWMTEFDPKRSDGSIATGLDRMTRHARRRWVNIDSEMRAAHERNARISQRRHDLRTGSGTGTAQGNPSQSGVGQRADAVLPAPDQEQDTNTDSGPV